MDLIIVAILVLILGAAAFYVYKTKKKGRKCIGCPSAHTCAYANSTDGCKNCPGAEMQ